MATHRIIVQQNVRRGRRGGNLFSRFFGSGRRGSGGIGGSGKRPRRRSEWFSYVMWGGAALFFAGAVAVVGMYAWFAKELPDPEHIGSRAIQQTTHIYDRTGKTTLYQVHGDQKRTSIELEDVSPYVAAATIAAEDKNFYEHRGFSITGYLRAFYNNFRTGTRGEGGSTITQQLVKNAVLSSEKTYTRKIKELVLSYELERRFTKDEILKMYLNEIPYGPVIYGVQSAAESFFNKDAKDLTISEAAMITAVSNATTFYSPYGNNTDALLRRTHWIVDQMATTGAITTEEAEEAKQDDLLARLQPQRATIIAPHFVFHIRQLLAREYGENLIERGGLRVITSIDLDKQAAAEKAIRDNRELIARWGGNTAMLAATDPRNGDILAMIGSADYFDESINGNFNAALGRLQPGSSIKPLVYAAFFERGFTPDTVLFDVETEFSDGATSYRPRNYNLREHGPVTVRQALAGSLNIPAVKALYLTGMPYFAEFSKRLGYTTLDNPSRFGLSLVLGGAEVVPLEHINAFGAFAQDGMLHDPRAILRIEDMHGNVLYEAPETAPGRRALDEEIARQVNGILSSNAERAWIFGESSHLVLGERPAGVKTGTTNGNRDAWAVGYVPSLVSGVWVGNSNGSAMRAGSDGSVVAAPIWNAFMRAVLAGTPVESFPEALPVETGKPVLDGEKATQVRVRIDTITGKLATEYTPTEYVEERGFGVPHSILFFVDPADPRGAAPEHPERDPQFARWEEAIADWVARQGADFSTDPPPSDYDDVHIPENFPIVSIVSPRDNQALNDRAADIRIDAFARRGVSRVRFALDGEVFAERPYPVTAPVIIPNRFPKGFHTLTVTALDDVGNAGSARVTINLMADAGPLGVEWETPQPFTALYSGNFPVSIRFRIEDVRGIRTLRLIARQTGGNGRETVLGVINDPALARMSMTWSSAPESGNYTLVVQATLVGGETREESIPVTVVR